VFIAICYMKVQEWGNRRQKVERGSIITNLPEGVGSTRFLREPINA